MRNLIFISFIPFIFLGCGGTSPTAPTDVNYTKYEGHTVGQKWVDKHGWWARNLEYYECKYCHGNNYEGTERSLILNTPPRFEFNFGDGFIDYKIGDRVSCYDCHTNGGPNGPEFFNNGLDNNF